jgi:hypothetical protein
MSFVKKFVFDFYKKDKFNLRNGMGIELLGSKNHVDIKELSNIETDTKRLIRALVNRGQSPGEQVINGQIIVLAIFLEENNFFFFSNFFLGENKCIACQRLTHILNGPE